MRTAFQGVFSVVFDRMAKMSSSRSDQPMEYPPELLEALAEALRQVTGAVAKDGDETEPATSTSVFNPRMLDAPLVAAQQRPATARFTPDQYATARAHFDAQLSERLAILKQAHEPDPFVTHIGVSNAPSDCTNYVGDFRELLPESDPVRLTGGPIRSQGTVEAAQALDALHQLSVEAASVNMSPRSDPLPD